MYWYLAEVKQYSFSSKWISSSPHWDAASLNCTYYRIIFLLNYCLDRQLPAKQALIAQNGSNKCFYPFSGTLMMTTSNHTGLVDISMAEEKDESVIVEASLMGSIDTRWSHCLGQCFWKAWVLKLKWFNVKDKGIWLIRTPSVHLLSLFKHPKPHCLRSFILNAIFS